MINYAKTRNEIFTQHEKAHNKFNLPVGYFYFPTNNISKLTKNSSLVYETTLEANTLCDLMKTTHSVTHVIYDNCKRVNI